MSTTFLLKHTKSVSKRTTVTLFFCFVFESLFSSKRQQKDREGDRKWLTAESMRVFSFESKRQGEPVLIMKMNYRNIVQKKRIRQSDKDKIER